LGFDSIRNFNFPLGGNNDGIRNLMRWEGNEDGILVCDQVRADQCSDASKFEFQHSMQGVQTNLELLQVLDTNRGCVAQALLDDLPSHYSAPVEQPISEPLRRPITQTPGEAELTRQAALFNQFCNIELNPEIVPLGTIPIESSTAWDCALLSPADAAHMQLHAA
jgi:hypothetical protein